MRFTKMHGCGNDYVYVDAWAEELPTDVPALARALSDRHKGIGADGLIIIGPATGADATMTMYNADGSQSEMCGNGIRCAAKLAYDHKRVSGSELRIATGAGVLDVSLEFGATKRQVIGASVLMGKPRLEPAQVPVIHPGPGPKLRLRLAVDGQPYRMLAVGMGNPHAVIFVDDPESFPVAKVGSAIERHAKFPRRTNVEFVARLPDEGGLPVLRQRTWERGAGETQACGTGACATAVAAMLDGVISEREVIVRLNGGDLRISWPRPDAVVRMTGPAVTVYEGIWKTSATRLP